MVRPKPRQYASSTAWSRSPATAPSRTASAERGFSGSKHPARRGDALANTRAPESSRETPSRRASVDPRRAVAAASASSNRSSFSKSRARCRTIARLGRAGPASSSAASASAKLPCRSKCPGAGQHLGQRRLLLERVGLAQDQLGLAPRGLVGRQASSRASRRAPLEVGARRHRPPPAGRRTSSSIGTCRRRQGVMRGADPVQGRVEVDLRQVDQRGLGTAEPGHHRPCLAQARARTLAGVDACRRSSAVQPRGKAGRRPSPGRGARFGAVAGRSAPVRRSNASRASSGRPRARRQWPSRKSSV